MSEVIRPLEQNWQPRLAKFWKRLTTHFAPIQQVANACLALFHQKHFLQNAALMASRTTLAEQNTSVQLRLVNCQEPEQDLERQNDDKA